MKVSELLVDAFGRIREGVANTLDGMDKSRLCFRPTSESNSIAWLVWHLTRIQDDHIAHVAGTSQLWTSAGWCERFGLPFEASATGYGQRDDEVARVDADAALLGGYHEAVADRTIEFVSQLSEADLDRVVDERWDPPVTLGVRLVSVIEDDFQHVGQAAYLKGLTASTASRG